MGERALFVEVHDEVPFTVLVEDEDKGRGWRSWHDVENVAPPGDTPYLWHQNVGGGGGSVKLGRFHRRWRRGFRPAGVWWEDGDVEVLALRPMVDRLIHAARWLEAHRLDASLLRWLDRAERWVLYGRASRLSLWRMGYRRLRTPPIAVPVDDPWRDMCEGETVWCQVCKRRYVADDCHCYMSHADLEGYDPVRAAARWLASELLRDAALGWGKQGRADVERAFEDRLQHEASRASDLVEDERSLLLRAKERFPDLVAAAARRLADELGQDTGEEECEHLCAHVWWEDGGVGWAGPGVDL